MLLRNMSPSLVGQAYRYTGFRMNSVEQCVPPMSATGFPIRQPTKSTIGLVLPLTERDFAAVGSRRDVLHLRFSECLLAEVLAQRGASVQIHLTPENTAQFGFYGEEVKPRSEPRLKFNEGIDVTCGGKSSRRTDPKNASL